MRFLLAVICLLAAPVGAQTWTPTASLPDGYNGHALVASSGFLYNIGGLSSTNGALDAQRVFVAAVQPDGGLSSWTETSSMPSGVFYHAGVAARGFVYVLGGYHYDSANGLNVSDGVYVARQNADGTLGAWTAAPALPATLFFASAAYWNGSIYVTGGWDGQQLSNAVYAAVVHADGTLGAWTTQRALPEGVYTHAAVSDGTLYVLGGVVNGGTEIQNTVYAAVINADGTLGPWAQTTPLPIPVSNHGAAVASGRVYVLGGWDGSQQRAEVYSAPSGPPLGAWAAEPALPKALEKHGVAVWNGRLYVSGGNDPVETQKAVYWRALPPPPPPPAPKDTLPPQTTLAVGQPQSGSFVAPVTPFSLTAADDLSGVASTQWSVDDGSVAAYSAPFTIAAEGAHWLRYYSVDAAGNAEAVHLASAAVDATAPASSLSVGAPRAVLADGTVVVSTYTALAAQAQDPVSNGVASGVASLTATVDGAAVTAPSSFLLPAVDGPHAVSLKATDNVGNAEAAHTQTVFVHQTPPVTALQLSAAAYAPADGGLPFLGAGVSLSFSAQDPPAGGVSAGVNRTEYAVDDAAVAVATCTLVLGEGSHHVRFRSVDNVGNAEGWKSSGYRVDATAPQTTFTIGSPVTMVDGAPVVTPDTPLSLSAADPAGAGAASGVQATVYSIDGGADHPYAGPFRLGVGRHAVSFGSTDNAGNAEPRRSVLVSVQAGDTLPPRTTLSWLGAAGGAFVPASAAAALSSVDDLSAVFDARGSGVASISWSLDAAPFSVYAGTAAFAEGAHWLRYFASDLAGNAETVRVTSFSVDGTSPASTLSVGAPRAALDSGELLVSSGTLLSVSASDPLSSGVASGVASVTATVDGRPVDAAAPFALPAADGPHAVSVRAVDAAGNAEAAHGRTIFVDATAPVSALSSSVAAVPASDGGAAWLSASAALSLGAQDPVVGGIASGVNRVEYTLDGGAAASAAQTLVLSEGAHALSYRAVDNVGNAGAWNTASYRVDATAPQTTLSLGSPVLTLFGRRLVTTQTPLSLAAADPVSGGVASGVSRVVYSVDGGADRAYAGPFTLPAGAHTLSYGAVDDAGNAEPRQTASIAVGTFLAEAAAAAESLSLSGGSSVNGDARAPQVSLNGHSTISGTVTRQAPVEAVDIAAAKAFAQSSDDNAAIARYLDADGSLSLSNGSVTLAEGVYYLTGLKLSGHGSLSVAGRAQVFVAGAVQVSGNGSFNGSGEAGSLWLFSDGPSVSVTGNGRAVFELYAPNAAAQISGGGQVAGRLYARTLSLTGHAVLPSTESLPASSLPPGRARQLDRPVAQASGGDGDAKVGGSAKHVASADTSSGSPAPASADRGSRSDGPKQRQSDLPAPPASRAVAQSSQTYSGAAVALGRPSSRPLPPASDAHEAVTEAAAPAAAAPSAPAASFAAAPPAALGRPVKRRHARPLAIPLAPKAAVSVVDASGSEVRSKEGTGVVVPPGAVASGLSVTVSAAATPAPAETKRQDSARGALGIVPAGEPVQFGPEGTRFARPVTIELPFDKTLLAEGVPASALAVHYWNPRTSNWEPLPSVVDAQTGLVRAQTSHFSLYQVHASSTAVSSAQPAAGSGGLAIAQAYAYPNPARHGARPVIHVDAAGADAVDFSVFDLSGALLQQGTAGVAGGVAEYTVDTGKLGSGVYLFVVKAKAQGQGAVKRQGRLAVIK